jgi:hypothetical protein
VLLLCGVEIHQQYRKVRFDRPFTKNKINSTGEAKKRKVL